MKNPKTTDLDDIGISERLVDLLAYYPLTGKVKHNFNIDNLFDEDYEERAFGNIWG